jgi:hypothetical protein
MVVILVMMVMVVMVMVVMMEIMKSPGSLTKSPLCLVPRILQSP